MAEANATWLAIGERESPFDSDGRATLPFDLADLVRDHRRELGRRPPASIQASDPPPAPIVWMSTSGSSSDNPASCASLDTVGAQSITRLASNDVPPMSMHIRFERSSAAASRAPPTVPPDRPGQQR